MSSLRDFQEMFGAAVRGASATDMGVFAAAPIPLERRLDVYRNNVHASLIDGLERAFPVVERLVGREFFRAMAREYLRSHMPARGTLVGFGTSMPEFLETFPPLASLPYLADVARLELAWLRSYHAADVGFVTADDLATVPAEEISELTFELHPSLEVLSSPFPIYTIWQSNQAGQEPQPIDLDQGGESVLIMRSALTVSLHKVGDGVQAFTNSLASNESLGMAAEVALEKQEDFDLASILHLFLSGGGFVRVTPPKRME